jgi:hypothetical protein
MSEKPDKTDIARLYKEFEEALTDFADAALAADDDVLPRRAQLAAARERLRSHPEVNREKYERIVLKAWDFEKRSVSFSAR